jgi:hypothetical protein
MRFAMFMRLPPLRTICSLLPVTVLALSAATASAQSSMQINGAEMAAAVNAAASEIKPLPSPVKMSFCVFDLEGANGTIASIAKDLSLDARKWNLMVDVRVYTDERVEAEDFKAGQCDGAAMSTLRAKQFNRMVGSIDAPGNLRNYDEMKTLLKTLAAPAFSAMSVTGRYQVAGILPIGSIFVMVNDRRINSIEKAAGKRVVVLDWDQSQSKMISAIGAQPVPSDLTSFSGKFNNGQADIIAAPAMAYKPLELYRGVGSKGGVIRFPLLQATGTILIRRDFMLPKIPDLDTRLGQIRQFGLAHLDQIMGYFVRAESDIPQSTWIDLTEIDRKKYQQMLREARIHMTKDGTYDASMMNLLKRVRCKHEPSNEECTMYDE